MPPFSIHQLLVKAMEPQEAFYLIGKINLKREARKLSPLNPKTLFQVLIVSTLHA
jgi:hypothetical protein